LSDDEQATGSARKIWMYGFCDMRVDRQTDTLITVLQTGTSIYLVADVAQPGVTPDKKVG